MSLYICRYFPAAPATSYTRTIMGFFGMSSTNGGPKGIQRLGKDDAPPDGAAADDIEELDEESGNILLSLISQLRIGMDLHRVTLPTFVLEPRSMLERITDFLSHPDIIFGASREPDAQQRFLAVLAYYMSGWHIKPRGVKKPYNPVLGEFFRCSYEYGNGTRGYYVAEQVSHHPPVSAYYYISEANNLVIYGDVRPKSKFLGNSAATIMEGSSRIVFLDRLSDGAYNISFPNMYARGILFGKMVLELGDTSSVQNKNLDMSSDVDFKVKGYFTGTYNAIGAKVMHGNKAIGELSGKWSDQLYYTDYSTGKTSVMFDAHTAKFAQKQVPPISEQEPNESQRCVFADPVSGRLLLRELRQRIWILPLIQRPRSKMNSAKARVSARSVVRVGRRSSSRSTKTSIFLSLVSSPRNTVRRALFRTLRRFFQTNAV